MMKKNRQFLTELLKTIQMGQVEIRSVLDTSLGSGLRSTLETQLREYDSIETEVYTIALQRGWELPELDPAVRMMTDMMTRMKLHHPNPDSKIADMMIIGGTSLMVYPAAGLCDYFRGNNLVVINLSDTAKETGASLAIHRPIGEVLREAVSMLEEEELDRT